MIPDWTLTTLLNQCSWWRMAYPKDRMWDSARGPTKSCKHQKLFLLPLFTAAALQSLGATETFLLLIRILCREYFFTKVFGKWTWHTALSQQVAEKASVSAAKSLPKLAARLFAPCDALFLALVHRCLAAGTTNLSYQLRVHGTERDVRNLPAAVSSLRGNGLKKWK